MQQKANGNSSFYSPLFSRGGRQTAKKVFSVIFCLLTFNPLLPLKAQEPAGPDFRSRCPADLDTLMTDLLQDLPGYVNRVIQRTSGNYVPRYVIVASQAEFEPLPQGPGPNNTPVSRLPSRQELLEPADDIRQVFFTTLERYYAVTDGVKYEQFHWLFLTRTADGWRLVLMYSRTSYPQGAVPTPPRDSSDSEMARAIRLWLKDCRARA